MVTQGRRNGSVGRKERPPPTPFPAPCFHPRHTWQVCWLVYQDWNNSPSLDPYVPMDKRRYQYWYWQCIFFFLLQSTGTAVMSLSKLTVELQSNMEISAVTFQITELTLPDLLILNYFDKINKNQTGYSKNSRSKHTESPHPHHLPKEKSKKLKKRKNK